MPARRRGIFQAGDYVQPGLAGNILAAIGREDLQVPQQDRLTSRKMAEKPCSLRFCAAARLSANSVPNTAPVSDQIGPSRSRK
jgi:hypothetical protein